MRLCGRFAPRRSDCFAPTWSSRGLSAPQSCIDEPHGDPVLDRHRRAGEDERARRTRAIGACRARAARGAVEPDRRYDGEWAGLTGVDLVIVAARRKPGWTKGTFVITGDGWFTLGEPFDRPTPNGLRTIYPLTLQRHAGRVAKSVSLRIAATYVDNIQVRPEPARRDAKRRSHNSICRPRHALKPSDN